MECICFTFKSKSYTNFKKLLSDLKQLLHICLEKTSNPDWFALTVAEKKLPKNLIYIQFVGINF